MRLFLNNAFATTLAICAIGTSIAQSFPTKPITVVNTQAAGGPTDVTMRYIAQKNGRRLQLAQEFRTVSSTSGVAARSARSPPFASAASISRMPTRTSCRRPTSAAGSSAKLDGMRAAKRLNLNLHDIRIKLRHVVDDGFDGRLELAHSFAVTSQQRRRTRSVGPRNAAAAYWRVFAGRAAPLPPESSMGTETRQAIFQRALHS